jgi:hypothetical protein
MTPSTQREPMLETQQRVLVQDSPSVVAERNRVRACFPVDSGSYLSFLLNTVKAV